MATPSFPIRVCLGLIGLVALVAVRISAQEAVLEATPRETAPAGSTVTVKWKGPNGPGDFITVVATGSVANAYLDYKPTSDGRAPVNPVSLVLPAKPGAYEIRYVVGNPRRVLATVPFTVTEVAAAIEAPEKVAPDARFDVTWSGPNNSGDWVTIVAVDAPVSAYGSYIDARNGKEDEKTSRRVATLRAPAKPGAYELRYVQQGKIVIGTRAIEVAVPAPAAPGAVTPAVAGAEAGAAQGAGTAPGAVPSTTGTAAGGAAAGGAGPVTGSGAAASSAAGPSGRAAGAGAAGATGGIAGGAAGASGSTASTAGSDTPTRTIPSTTGRVLTQGEGTVNTWSGWARCVIRTTTPGTTNVYYDASQTHTWTISGPGTIDGSGVRYPATWSVSGAGAMSRAWSGPGSYPNGDYEYGQWEATVSGVAAPLVFAIRASDNRVVLGSGHARGLAQVSVLKWIGNYDNTKTSPGSSHHVQAPLPELTLPVIGDVATSTRLSGSSSPAVTETVSPLQPAEARSTASCTWLFEKGTTFSALQPPPPPIAKKTLPRPTPERHLPGPVQVLTPNGPEDWAVNSRQTVTWAHSLGTGHRFDIDISLDGGTTWLPLGRNVSDDGSGSRGTFTVAMPAVGSAAGLVRVSPAGNTRDGDVSDRGFKLGAAWLKRLERIDVFTGPGRMFSADLATNLGDDERYTIVISYSNGTWQTLTTSATLQMHITVPPNAPVNSFATVRVTSNSVPTVSVLVPLSIRQ